MTDQPLRIGVLGASRIAEAAIVGPARELGHRLVVVAARDRGRAETFAATHGVERVADSYIDVVQDTEIDLVYNPLANSLHGPWNLAAIAAGTPVLSEKPFARNAVEALEVADAARSAGVPVLEGFHYAFHPLMEHTRKLIGDGTIGTLRRVEIEMGMPEPGPSDPRWDYRLAGGAIMDLGCYGLHLLRALGTFAGGAPVITGATAVLRGEQIDESARIEVEYPDGASGMNVNSMVAGEFTFRCRIVGSAGELVVHNFLAPTRDNRLTVVTGTETRVEEVSSRSTYTFQLEAFAATLRHDAPLPIDLDDAVTNMTYIDEAYRKAGMEPR
ncbi:Gfo/Idh/MocA family oxidoreductase [Gordonia sp. NB41Y]|uniref:Gfo/Idh/MocA family protein n=1 Tax=Gordonia sp. NB41Y TaxID=875808 RepID=UPI0002BFD7B3|nr:Gfo/Idh/MocA family oxidoreductase [Gordonia sp. NB41Y]EMP14595.1 oxidoreductase [Gordonia sp. NB41Y]WLP89801.1 Gfo/Idh/MocA family oxidoreductase [Gordonia sp. NB41Y]